MANYPLHSAQNQADAALDLHPLKVFCTDCKGFFYADECCFCCHQVRNFSRTEPAPYVKNHVTTGPGA